MARKHSCKQDYPDEISNWKRSLETILNDAKTVMVHVLPRRYFNAPSAIRRPW